ncbi:hypothetical protein B0T22DRAFT_430187 [Podospora appendiculata]|uniref:magnesium chelatase n=1 Tax=Podospora appendiculata TaxID=314037 RepID=A0AAE0X6E2_9PEZI|nr:hypothetical protein B0T22DRAFT_430187 [Podospora appendiculata]
MAAAAAAAADDPQQQQQQQQQQQHQQQLAPLLDKIHSLSDLELAVLLSLIAHEHCLISTEADSVDELADELRLVATRTFGLTSVIVNCHAHMTLDDFATALLIPPLSSPTTNAKPRSVSPYHSRSNDPPLGSYFQPHPGASTSATPATATATPGLKPPPHSSSIIPISPSSVAPTHPPPPPPPPQIANIVLAKHLDRAPRAIQIQALELLRTRRIFTRTSVHAAPKPFLLVPVLGAPSGGQARVTPHLNDWLYIAHWHDPADGFANLDDEDDDDNDDNDDISNTFKPNDPPTTTTTTTTDNNNTNPDDSASIASGTSVVKRMTPNSPSTTPAPPPIITEADLLLLAHLAQQARVDVDVARYQMNIITFLRMHRAVAGGVSPTATQHLGQLMRSLAPLHGLDYVTPSLVGLAARKVYLHRLAVVAPERERSMQWGSELAAVEALLEGVGPEDVVDDVLGMVAVPQ